VLAVLVSMLLAIALRASHPPAAATTLLVALGSISTGGQALNVVAGAAILAAAGEGLRALRMGKLRARKARREAGRRRAPELREAPAP
jgi:CBS-domain-containing membrane protein